jgi:hypothetical protein
VRDVERGDVSRKLIVRDAEIRDDQWIMNCERCGKKR